MTKPGKRGVGANVTNPLNNLDTNQGTQGETGEIGAEYQPRKIQPFDGHSKRDERAEETVSELHDTRGDNEHSDLGTDRCAQGNYLFSYLDNTALADR